MDIVVKGTRIITDEVRGHYYLQSEEYQKFVNDYLTILGVVGTAGVPTFEQFYELSSEIKDLYSCGGSIDEILGSSTLHYGLADLGMYVCTEGFGNVVQIVDGFEMGHDSNYLIVFKSDPEPNLDFIEDYLITRL